MICPVENVGKDKLSRGESQKIELPEHKFNLTTNQRQCLLRS